MPAALQMILRNLVENSVRHSRRQSGQRAADRRSAAVATSCWNTRITVAASPPAPGAWGACSAAAPHSSGAGVGLYLVRRLMQRMRGRARFDTAPGEGFRCELWFRVSA